MSVLFVVTVSLLPAASLFILPESPRWLVVNGHLDMALAVIHRVYIGSVLPAGQLAVSVHAALLQNPHNKAYHCCLVMLDDVHFALGSMLSLAVCHEDAPSYTARY